MSTLLDGGMAMKYQTHAPTDLVAAAIYKACIMPHAIVPSQLALS